MKNTNDYESKLANSVYRISENYKGERVLSNKFRKLK